jgi:hypothetical protein
MLVPPQASVDLRLKERVIGVQSYKVDRESERISASSVIFSVQA